MLVSLAYSDLTKVSTSNGTNKNLSQHFAIQIFFDLKFIKFLFNKKFTNTNEIENFLAKFIDPFDFDILNSNIDLIIWKSINRINVMYGVIYKHNSTLSNSFKQLEKNKGKSATSGTSTDNYSVLELAGAQGHGDNLGIKRINLLPISIETQMLMREDRRRPERLKNFSGQKELDSNSGYASKLFGIFY